MDDQLLIYLIFLVVAILSRLLKKKKPSPQSEEEDFERENNPPPVSFDDLLKEFRNKMEEPVREKARVPEKTREQILKEEREMEFKSVPPDDDEIDEVYQAAISQAQKQLQDPDYHPKFGHFEVFDVQEEENELVKEIRKDLESPESMAKAVVLSEILNRRY